ncbi:DUF3995 domain-containing protein [Bacillus sp. JJ1533]|uniref:DUF3995 domain-containing protein n=1 Tax=Bacillus sp. JJ1533 TaxID=3122959 RepID=UPI002FFFD906
MKEVNISKISLSARVSYFGRFVGFSKSSVWPAYIGCINALLYAVFIRFYHAAGGTIGMPGKIKDPAVFYMGSYMAGIIIMFCGFTLIALIKPWSRIVPKTVPLIGGRKVPPLLLLTPTLLSTAFLIAHGVSGIITKALLLAGFITIDFSGFVEVEVRNLALWDLLVYEPFFCLMGMMAVLTAAHYALASGVRESFFRNGTILFIIIVFLLTAFFSWAIIFDYVDKLSI